jgi:hypothetical protein
MKWKFINKIIAHAQLINCFFLIHFAAKIRDMREIEAHHIHKLNILIYLLQIYKTAHILMGSPYVEIQDAALEGQKKVIFSIAIILEKRNLKK